MMRKILILSAISLTLPFTLAGCLSGSDSSAPTAVVSKEAVANPLTINLAHVNDTHSNLDPSTVSMFIDGMPTNVELGGYSRLATAINQLTIGKDNTLKLHAGDAIVGTLYFTLFQGEADAAEMGVVCYDALALGNHEFDNGDASLKTFLDQLNSTRFAGACPSKVAVISANVTPEVGTPLAATTATDYIQPYVIEEFNGEKVGVVGVTTTVTTGSSSPLPTTRFASEVVAVQGAIDRLKSQNIKRIILVSHVGYDLDKVYAGQLTDVDVIVGGHSHTLLGDFKQYGLTSGGSYPTLLSNKDGDPVCVTTAWEYAKAVGSLQVKFDENQKIASCTGSTQLVVGDKFTRKDAAGKTYTVEGDELAAVKAYLAQDSQILFAAKNAASDDILAGYAGQVDTLKQTQIGLAEQTLCHARRPGDASKSADCDVAILKAHGSDIANIVAQAFLKQSLTSDIAIQNAGGVRIDVNQGPISIGTAYTLLPFANTMTELQMTGQEIKNVLEEAVDSAFKVGGSTGSYPYAAGLRWDVDMTQPFGQRIGNLQYKGKTDTGYSPLDLSKKYYKVVTNSFTAGGQDGYVTFGTVLADGRALDLYLDYAQSFVDYVSAVKTLNRLPIEDYSTQQFINSSGVMQ